MGGENRKSGWWTRLRRPSAKWSVGLLLGTGFVIGILFWGAFNTAMEMTNTEQFCVSCHAMREHMYAEYKESPHYRNASGVRATCPDCHVPKAWHYKVLRKIEASNELWHMLLGSIDSKENFVAKRQELAERVWATMRETDSRECRNCHDFNAMAFDEQDKRARLRHQKADEKGKTCIDCHQGVVHELP
ncbi:MAG: NapC/NirT family cytochrome c [Gammaproteobacteria bacterium]